MKEQIEKEELNLATIAAEYSTEKKARKLFEELRWPNGAKCPYCACDKPYKLKLKPIKNRPARNSIYKCRKCRKQFTATIGTVMESSHIPIQKWLMAIFLISSSKKAISAHQMHRTLGIDYKSAWFMCHRIRHAVKFTSSPEKLKGQVEADEGFFGRQKLNPETGKRIRQQPVVALIERGSGMRVKVVERLSCKTIGDFLRDNIARGATLNTDGNPNYNTVFLPGIKHDSVNHSGGELQRERADGSKIHVNNCESFFSLFKRGVTGAFHHISREHLHRYADEFAFRWNTRKLTDGARFEAAIGMVDGKRLKYREAVAA